MTAKAFKKFFTTRTVIYFFLSGLIFIILFLGSQYKTRTKAIRPIMHSISQSNFSVSMDRIAEMYLVADLAYSMNLATKNYINMDYVSVVTQYALNQTGGTKLEKPNVINIPNLSRGVREYVVNENDNMDSIANRFHLSTDQIRWSNGLKDKNLFYGQQLYLPTVSGIVYTVKDGDTFEKISNRYGTPREHIIAYNDLENTHNLKAGEKILLPSGQLPENERPENQIIQRRQSPIQVARFSTSAGNPLPYGWCTWYAWEWRKNNMPWNFHLPGGGLGDARYWDSNLRNHFYIDKVPSYGSIFQNKNGYYGHVGIVTAVNDDGSITISDMNGVSGWGRVGSTNIPRGQWIYWSFIHQAIGT